jgi:hypothetical protein
MREGEPEESYIAAFRGDFGLEAELLNKNVSESFGHKLSAFAYPFGLSDGLSAVLLNELGIKATFTTQHGQETVVKGLPASLLGLKRIAAGEDMTGEDIKILLRP